MAPIAWTQELLLNVDVDSPSAALCYLIGAAGSRRAQLLSANPKVFVGELRPVVLRLGRRDPNDGSWQELELDAEDMALTVTVGESAVATIASFTSDESATDPVYEADLDLTGEITAGVGQGHR